MRTKNCESLSFNDFWLRLIATPVISFSVPAIFFNVPFSTPNYIKIGFISMFFTIFYWEGNRWIHILLLRKFNRFEDVGTRLVWQTILSVVFTVGSCGIMNQCCTYILSLFQITKESLHETPFQHHTAALVSLAVIMGIYESAYFFNRWKMAMMEKERLEKEGVISQLASLKHQVNPHFLFNSLNTLVYLIPTDQQRAVRFVEQMSKVYRYILEIRNKNTVTIQEEVDFLQSYVFLLKERFGENLQVTIDVPSSYLTDDIVPLSCQILFENAIKHNVISAQYPLKIDLRVDNDKLVVSNNLQKKHQVVDSTGFGLENIRSRYELLCGRGIDVLATVSNFIVALPILK